MPKKIIRLPAVKALTGLSRSTIYLWVRDKEFPAPISLGERAVGWIESEILSWIDQRINRSRQAGGVTRDPGNQRRKG